MAKEILFYSPIYDFTAADYIMQLEANKGDAVVVRMNCPGGSVYAAIGCIAKFNEFPKSKKIKVDGQAKSGGFFMCVCADDVEALDMSDFMAHRAAYPDYIENNPKIFTDEVKADLAKTNDKLRAMIEAKVSADIFKSVTGISLDDMFSLDSRIDVNITAKQMKQMGIVSKITPLTSAKKTEIMSLAASYGVAAFAIDTTIIDNKTNENMTIAEFKAASPEAYRELIKSIATEAVTAERDRVGSWMAFNEVDPEAVKKGIASGADISKTQISEFSLKALSKNALVAVSADSAAVAGLNTPETKPEDVAAKAEADAFKAEVKANLKNIR